MTSSLTDAPPSFEVFNPAGKLCRCGKPLAHLDAHPDSAEWACRIPDPRKITPLRQPNPEPLVDAILRVAEHRTDFGRDWPALLAGFGDALDQIAADLHLADEYETGMRDHEVPSTAAAEAECDRLRANARGAAQSLAAMIGRRS